MARWWRWVAAATVVAGVILAAAVQVDAQGWPFAYPVAPPGTPVNYVPITSNTTGTATWGPLPGVDGGLAPGTAGQLFQTNATPATTWVTPTGDWTINSSGVDSVAKINGASVPAAGSLTAGNVLQVSGSSALTYAPVNLAGGSNNVTGNLPTTNFTPGTAGQILQTNTTPAAAWQTVTGDTTISSSAVTTTGAIHGATVPAAGALTTGNVLQVNGASSDTYGPVNLAGGSNYVTGVLPTGNQAAQSLSGDVTGTTASDTVVAISGAAPVNVSNGALSFSANAATAGNVRVPNNTTIIAARNAANNANIPILSTDSTNDTLLNAGNVLYFELGATAYLQLSGTADMSPAQGVGTTTLGNTFAYGASYFGANSSYVGYEAFLVPIGDTGGNTLGTNVRFLVHKTTTDSSAHTITVGLASSGNHTYNVQMQTCMLDNTTFANMGGCGTNMQAFTDTAGTVTTSGSTASVQNNFTGSSCSAGMPTLTGGTNSFTITYTACHADNVNWLSEVTLLGD